MTYRAKQHGAAIVEVPITFVDRAAGESKMSSRIVFEALALVTWWGMGRVLHGLQREHGQLTPADPVRSA
jgi:dolichol-phosphate mannosyltransferase